MLRVNLSFLTQPLFCLSPNLQQRGGWFSANHFPQTTFQPMGMKSSHEHIKVLINDIYSITSDSDYTEIHLADKKILSNESLRHWVDVLGGNHFYQIHKSHIINTQKIDRISGNLVSLTNGAKIPMGRAYKDNFLKSILP